MRLFFQNPLWIAAALALVPLLAHLFSRTRPRTREFPSVYLLREALRRVTRIRRPRDFWLLLLRTLAAAALALAFLQPLWIARERLAADAKRTVVLVVDATASMGYADGTRSRFAQAVAAASAYLDKLPSGSRANVVWGAARPSPALPEPGPNLAFLRTALQQATVRAESGDARAALALATRQLARAQGARELVVFSDFQKPGWKDAAWDVPAGTKITRVSTAEGQAANVALGAMECEPVRPQAGRAATLTCRVRNFSGEPRRAVLLAQAGEERLQQAVEVLPWGEAPAVFSVKFNRPGLTPVKVTLAEDRFPADDRRYGVVEVRGALHATVCGATDDATASVWARALEALGNVEVRRTAPGGIVRGTNTELLLVAGWNGGAAEVLDGMRGRGVPMVIQPAPGVSLETLAGGTEGAVAETRVEEREGGWRLRIASEEHPVFVLFAGGAFGDPVSATVKRRVHGAPGGQWTPLVACDDGAPAVALQAGDEKRGPLVCWNVDLGASDWPARPGFVAVLGELCRFLTEQAGRGVARSFEPGDQLRFEPPAGQEGGSVQLLDESGGVVPTQPAGGTDGALVSAEVAAPGTYRWADAGTVLDRAVVNFPEVESDLRPMSEAELAALPGAVVHATAQAVLDERDGRPLWPWCVGFAVLCLLTEGGVLFFGQDRRAGARMESNAGGAA